jgi:hypothetical protein
MVLLAEQGKRMHRKTENVVIFNHSMDNIRCKIVYTFKDHKLRAAGYITDTPVKGAQNIIKRSVVELGEPTQILNDGMLWITENTLIYSNAYISRIDVPANPEYQKSGGILSHLLQSQQPTGEIRRWDGVWAYIDQDFFREINEASHPYPLDALSFHEKLLFGVLKRYPIYNYLNQIQLPATPR